MSRGRDRCADFVRAPVAAFPLSVFARSAAREEMPAPKPSRTCSWQLRAPPQPPWPSQLRQSSRSSPATSQCWPRAGSRRRQNSIARPKRSRLSNALALTRVRPSAAARRVQRLVRQRTAGRCDRCAHRHVRHDAARFHATSIAEPNLPYVAYVLWGDEEIALAIYASKAFDLSPILFC